MENTKTEEASQMQLDWMYLITGIKNHPNWSCPSCNWFKIHSHSHAYSQQLLSGMRIKRTMTTRGPQSLSSNCVCFHPFATALTCYADMLGKKKTHGFHCGPSPNRPSYFGHVSAESARSVCFSVSSCLYV